MILCVAGNPSVDKLFEVERVTPGRIHRPLLFVQVAGGKGLNVARAAGALGAEVVATGLLAGHAGRWIEEALASEGIRSRFAWAGGETRHSLSVADRHTEGLTEFYEAGTEVTLDEWYGLEAVVAAALPGASWMTMSGSLPPGAPAEGYAVLVGAAREAGVATAVDAHGPPLVAALEARPDVVKINRHEAAELLGASEDPADAARALRDKSGGEGHAAVMTMGPDGAILAAPDGSTWRGTLDARGPYPVGSGDAFLAGLITALEDSRDWPAALAPALGAAAANAEVPGAGRLDPAEAKRLAAASVVERV